MPHPDLLIIGGGAIGLSLAEAALRAQLRVAVLDQGPMAQEASWAGAGMLTCRPWPKTSTAPDVHDLGLASVRLHAEWYTRLLAETGVDTGYRVWGALELMPEAGGSNAERQIEGCGARGIRVRRISAVEARKLEPCLAGNFVEALEYPDEPQVRNPWFARALETSIRRRGGALLPHTAVADILIEQDRAVGVVLKDGSRKLAGAVAVCSGAWSGAFPVFREHLPRVGKIHPVRGQILCYELAPDFARRLLTVENHYVVPRGDGILLVGATHEKVGFDKSTTADGRQELEAFAHALMPALKSEVPVKTWAGLRPGMKGNHPVIGEVPHVRSLYVSAGHYRSGLTLAPASAEVLVAIVRGERHPLQDGPWNPVAESSRNGNPVEC